MAVSFYVKVDEARFKSLIEQRGNQWAKSLDYTMRTMKRKAPTIVARNSAQVYNIAASRLNPNNKTASGSVSLSGGLTTLTLTYRGSKLPIGKALVKVVPERVSSVGEAERWAKGLLRAANREAVTMTIRTDSMLRRYAAGSVTELRASSAATWDGPAVVSAIRHDYYDSKSKIWLTKPLGY